MQDVLVSSRISRAKKDAGVAVLDSLGATTSELINSAFDYVIETHQLPSTATAKSRREDSSFPVFLAQSTLRVDWASEPRTYKDILRENKLADYESLA